MATTKKKAPPKPAAKAAPKTVAKPTTVTKKPAATTAKKQPAQPKAPTQVQYKDTVKAPTAPKQEKFDDSKYVAPTMADRVEYTDKSMAELSAQFGFKTDQGWFEELAQKQADIVKGAITSEQVKTQKGLNQANAMIDSDYFQQGLRSAQGVADRGLNAGMATEQGTRLAMSRQSALGGAYADAQGQMFQLGQQKIAADKQANIDAMSNWQDAVWKGADFTQRYNQDQYGRVQDTNAWNMQDYQNRLGQYNTDRQFGYQQNQDNNNWNMNMYGQQRDQYNQDRNFNYQKVQDQNSWNMDMYKTGLNQFNTNRDYHRGVLESDRSYNRGVYESNRSYNRGVYESNRDYNWNVKESNRDFGQRQYEFNASHQLDKDKFAFSKIQASKAGSGGGGGGSRGRSSGGGSSRKKSGGSSGGGVGTVRSTGNGVSTGAGVVNMQKEIAAQKSSSGASKGTNILIGSVKSTQAQKKAQQQAQKSLGISAPHLTGNISISKPAAKNKYTDLSRGRLW